MPFTIFKGYRVQKKLAPKPSASVPVEYSAPIIFSPLDQQSGLLPLGVAQMSPEIVYRSLQLLDQVVEFGQARSLRLVSLAEAQETDSIKRRLEGFEVEEAERQRAKWAEYREFIRLDCELPGEI